MALEDNQLLLIVRHLNIPEDEALAVAVNQWRAQEATHEQYYQQIRKLWETSAAAGALQDVDVNAAVAKLTAKISTSGEMPVGEAEEPPARIRPVRKIIGWSAAAAAVLVAGIVAYRGLHTPVVQMLTLSTHDRKDSLQLPDGSMVYLDAHSTVRYPAQFVAGNRTIDFSSGNAFFKIASDSLQPFTVKMDRTAVKVLGTSFNIHKDSLSIKVDVKTGRVMFMANDQPQAILNAGTMARFNLQTDSIITYSNQNQNSDAWLTGELRFVDEPLSKVFSKLEDHYHVKIDLDTNLSNLGKLNATFVNNDLSEVITLLQQTYPIRIERKGNRLIIRNK